LVSALDSAISGHWMYHAEKAFIRALPEHALAGSTTTQENRRMIELFQRGEISVMQV
jgi:hypothetical protein